MKITPRILAGAGLLFGFILITADAAGQRFGGGRAGGFAGGGARAGGFGGGVPMTRPAPAVRPNPVQSGTVHGAFGGTMTGARQTGTVVGATGPGGSVVAGSRGSVTTGPGGAVVTGGRGAVATGPGGTVAAASRGAVAVGPHGAVAAGGRAVAGRGVYGGYVGTRYVG